MASAPLAGAKMGANQPQAAWTERCPTLEERVHVDGAGLCHGPERYGLPVDPDGGAAPNSAAGTVGHLPSVHSPAAWLTSSSVAMNDVLF